MPRPNPSARCSDTKQSMLAISVHRSGARQVAREQRDARIRLREVGEARLEVGLELEVADLEEEPHRFAAGKRRAKRLRDAQRVLALGHRQHVAHREVRDVARREAEPRAVGRDRRRLDRVRHAQHGHRRLERDRLLAEGGRHPDFVDQAERPHPRIGKFRQFPRPEPDVVAAREERRAQVLVHDGHLVRVDVEQVDRVQVLGGLDAGNRFVHPRDVAHAKVDRRDRHAGGLEDAQHRARGFADPAFGGEVADHVDADRRFVGVVRRDMRRIPDRGLGRAAVHGPRGRHERRRRVAVVEVRLAHQRVADPVAERLRGQRLHGAADAPCDAIRDAIDAAQRPVVRRRHVLRRRDGKPSVVSAATGLGASPSRARRAPAFERGAQRFDEHVGEPLLCLRLLDEPVRVASAVLAADVGKRGLDVGTQPIERARRAG